MRFEELNWMDVEKYLRKDDRLIFTIGSCEQHGYLSLQTDIKIPMAIADSASQITGVPVAPAINFGSSPFFLKYPGTLSLRATTMLDVVEDLIRSAYGHGFRRMLFINGHAGNEGARGRLYELVNQLEGSRVHWYAWWLSESVRRVAEKHELKPMHANWLEAFAFTRVADLPEGEKTPPRVSGLLSAKETFDVYGDGTFGGPYQVDQTVMDEMFSEALQDVLQLLKFE